VNFVLIRIQISRKKNLKTPAKTIGVVCIKKPKPINYSKESKFKTSIKTHYTTYFSFETDFDTQGYA